MQFDKTEKKLLMKLFSRSMNNGSAKSTQREEKSKSEGEVGMELESKSEASTKKFPNKHRFFFPTVYF